jgi:hypothetical protein
MIADLEDPHGIVERYLERYTLSSQAGNISPVQFPHIGKHEKGRHREGSMADVALFGASVDHAYGRNSLVLLRH